MEESSGLELSIGDALQLQFVADERKRRYYSKVIGYLEGQSVLITTPRMDGKIIMVRDNQVVVVRMMTGNQVYGFNTRVLQSCLKPYPYVHLAYPKDLEKVVVRKSRRVETRLEASVDVFSDNITEKMTIKVLLIDISTSGALVIADRPLGRVGEMFSVTADIGVANVNETVTIPSIIRNVREGEEDGKAAYFHGVEFQLLEQHEHFVLHGFVYEQLFKAVKK